MTNPDVDDAATPPAHAPEASAHDISAPAPESSPPAPLAPAMLPSPAAPSTHLSQPTPSPAHAHAPLTPPPSAPEPATPASQRASSPVIFARGSPRSSIVLDISADRTAVEGGVDETVGTEEAEKEEGEKSGERQPAPVRLLGINYVPGQDEGAHPLQLDVSTPWDGAGRGADDDDDDNWLVKDTRVRHSFGHQQEISMARRTKPPVSAYPFGPPPPDAAFGTAPVGQLGVHHPREIVRVERDYSGGEIVQFLPTYPLEFEGRITPTQFLETINAFNEILISAYSLRHGFIDNLLDILTLHLSTFVMKSHYDREMQRLQRTMEQLNAELYNPVGLNILWPRRVGFLFLEIEYY